jgi:hypothetical protein
VKVIQKFELNGVFFFKKEYDAGREDGNRRSSEESQFTAYRVGSEMKNVFC